MRRSRGYRADPRRTFRTGKDTGLRNLPFHDLAHNRVWVAIAALAADLLAWTARLALPAHAATYGPNDSGCASWPWPPAS
ncbi:MAG TPA: hypothetical protein VF003_04400 [Pseudonocardiaceae bacterium]